MSSNGVQFPTARHVLSWEPFRAEIVNAAVLKLRVLDPSDELTQDQVYDEWQYLCHNCNTVVEPAGIGERTRSGGTQFKIPPHFSTKKGERHKQDNCNHITLSSGLNSSSQNAIERAYLEGYPNRLNLDDPFQKLQHPSISSQSLENQDQDRIQRTTGSRNWSVQEIAPLVRIFLNDELRQLPLHIAGVQAQTYEGVFQSIQFDTSTELDHLQIYFGEIVYRLIERERDRCTFWLTDRCFESGPHGSYPRPRASLSIDTSEWTSSERSRLDERINRLYSEIQASRANRRVVPLLFFLGCRQTIDNFEFSIFRGENRFFSFLVTDALNSLLPEITFSRATELQFPLSTNSETVIDETLTEQQVQVSVDSRINEDTINTPDDEQNTTDNTDDHSFDKPNVVDDLITRTEPEDTVLPSEELNENQNVLESDIEEGSPSRETPTSIRDRLFHRSSRFMDCIISGKTPLRRRLRDTES